MKISGPKWDEITEVK